MQNLWLAYIKTGSSTAFEPAPASRAVPLAGLLMLALAGLLALPLIARLVVFAFYLRAGRWVRATRASPSGLLMAALWGIVLAIYIYWFYARLPLPFPPAFIDLWRMPQTDLVTAMLLFWVLFSLASAWFQKKL